MSQSDSGCVGVGCDATSNDGSKCHVVNQEDSHCVADVSCSATSGDGTPSGGCHTESQGDSNCVDGGCDTTSSDGSGCHVVSHEDSHCVADVSCGATSGDGTPSSGY